MQQQSAQLRLSSENETISRRGADTKKRNVSKSHTRRGRGRCVTGTPQTSNFVKTITKTTKNVIFCLLTLNACNCNHWELGGEIFARFRSRTKFSHFRIRSLHYSPIIRIPRIRSQEDLKDFPSFLCFLENFTYLSQTSN